MITSLDLPLYCIFYALFLPLSLWSFSLPFAACLSSSFWFLYPGTLHYLELTLVSSRLASRISLSRVDTWVGLEVTTAGRGLVLTQYSVPAASCAIFSFTYLLTYASSSNLVISSVSFRFAFSITPSQVLSTYLPHTPTPTPVSPHNTRQVTTPIQESGSGSNSCYVNFVSFAVGDCTYSRSLQIQVSQCAGQLHHPTTIFLETESTVTAYRTPLVLGISFPPVRSIACLIASANALNADSALQCKVTFQSNASAPFLFPLR